MSRPTFLNVPTPLPSGIAFAERLLCSADVTYFHLFNGHLGHQLSHKVRDRSSPNSQNMYIHGWE